MIYSGTVGAAREAACKVRHAAAAFRPPGQGHAGNVAPSSVSPSSLVCHGAPYSGCPQDVPALAISLDNYAARSEEQYATAAAFTVAMMKAVLVSS